MTADALTTLTVAELSRMIHSRTVSPVELVAACLERIEALEPSLNAFITVMGDAALADARRAEQEIADGEYKGPLHGVPWAVKDLFWTRGVRTTSGSGVTADFVPDEDATAVQRLRSAGATIVGKTNMVDHAYGGFEHHELYGHPRNPWNLSHATGGSSSGSAAAVAAGEVPVALGTDTAGSIRGPAAQCGLTGMKPTYGLVSRFGVTPLSFSQDHVGPLAHSAEDVAIALDALIGHDRRDPSSTEVQVRDLALRLSGAPPRVRVGIPSELMAVQLHPDVETTFAAAVQTLQELGMNVEPVSLPETEVLAAVQMAITQGESAAYHADNLRDRADLFHPGVRVKLQAAQHLPASVYVQAQQARVLMMRRFSRLFEDFDLLATPTVPFPATRLDSSPGGPEALWFTRPFNPHGLPAISVPCGMSTEGLPLGLQLIGKPFDDALVIANAHAYQQATDWHARRPSVPVSRPGNP